ncbi:MAG TPA: hypothetical protein PLV68_09690, partial [Ilumatobacteraceae bacterium]|nr:hypothetical protein [Ilumatobacteraceae bacterium]
YYPQNSPLQTFNPVRIADSREALGIPAKLASNTEVQFQVAGLNGVPANATSVVLNLTVVDAPSGYLTAYPCGTPPPLASNVNAFEGRAVANLAVVGVGQGGKVCFIGNSPTHLVVDLQGYNGASSDYNAMTPVRVLDTRETTRVQSYAPVEVPLRGKFGVPNQADRVTVNVTAVGAVGDAFVTVYSCGTVPTVSSGNTSVNRIVATLATVDLSAAGSICVLSN